MENLKTNHYHANIAFQNWAESDLADHDVLKHPENREKVIELIQELERPICDLSVARIVKANRSKLIGDKMNHWKQTPEQRTAIVRDFFINNFAARFPNLEPIFGPPPESKIICPASFVIIQGDFHKAEILRADIIQEIIMKYESVLVQKKAPVIVEVERQPTAKEIAKDKFLRAHDAGLLNSSKHNRNELDDEFRGGKSAPLLTEPEKIAINARNGRINEVLGETLSSVNNYSAGRNHARTSDRRAELTALFNQHRIRVNDVEGAEKLARTIEEKINSYDRSSQV